jgi:hypothetical protein
MNAYRMFFTHCTFDCDINKILSKMWSGQVVTWQHAVDAINAAEEWQRLAYIATRKVALPESLRGQEVAGFITIVNLFSGEVVKTLPITRA